MKNILMIATGGTIASKEGDLGLTPAVTGEELAASVPYQRYLSSGNTSAYEYRQHEHAPAPVADDPRCDHGKL